MKPMVALRLFLFMTIVLGVVYPAVVFVVGNILFPSQAKGSLITNESGQIIGSTLIGQKFESSGYFWGRPSAMDYIGSTSGGTNLGPTSASLLESAEAREKMIRDSHPEEDSGRIPEGMIFSSGSGLDPHIMPSGARFQLRRVIKARKLSKKQAYDLTQKIEDLSEEPQLNIFGQARINVLELNRALDQIASKNY